MKCTKQLTLALIMLLLLGGTKVHAQDEEEHEVENYNRYYSVKANVFGVIAGQYQVAGEMALNDNMSLQLSAGYVRRLFKVTTDLFEGSFSIGPKGFIVIPEFRYYFMGSGIEGFYVTGFIRYRNVNQNVIDDLVDDGLDWSFKRSKTSVGGGATIGYQAILGTIAVLDVFIGPQFKSVTKGDWKFDDPTLNELDIPVEIDDKGDSNGVGVRFGVNLGIAF